jgi:CDP-diacylglycerol--glycerol-3-phosphate 3-phosphatidyltransferase
VNLPIALTLLRIFLVPVLVVVLLTRSPEAVFIGSFIFGLAVLTDYLDGYFARRRNQVTKLGILLDPLADKLLTTAAFISLVELGDVPGWMIMIILGREFAVTGLRNIAAGKGILIAASPLGKGKMVLQVTAIFLLLLGRRFELLHGPGILVLWLAVIVALVSGVDYFQRFFRGLYRPQPKKPDAAEAPEAAQGQAGPELARRSEKGGLARVR